MNRRNTVKCLAASLLLCSISWRPVHGVTNPRPATVYCKFVYQGEEWTVSRSFVGCGWVTTLEPWDGCFTGAGNRHDHAHPPHGYPFIYTPVGGIPIIVSAAMTDAYWDSYYSSYTRLSSATFSRNCYGYSIGFSGWPGMSQFITDDYTTAAVIDADIYYVSGPSESHGIRIDVICNNGCDFSSMKETTEKNGTSGVYKGVWYCPGGAGIWSNLYKED